MVLNNILKNYTKKICINYDAEKNIFTEKDVMFITKLPAFMKELMSTVYKDVSNDTIIDELIFLDSKKIIVKNFEEIGTVDYSKVKLSICENHLEDVKKKMEDFSLKDVTIDDLEKKLAAYKSIDDTENVNKTQEKIDLVKQYEKAKQAVEAAKQLESDVRSILKPTKYFQFADIIEKGRVDLLGLFIDSFREFDKKDLINKIPHNENKYKFLCAVKKLFPNVKSDSVHIAANAFAEFVQKIYFNLGVVDYNPQKMLYLYSMLGGTGKGVFMKRLEHFCNTYKIPVSPNANISTHWLNADFQLNAVSIIPEFFPYKSNMNEQIISLNNIIDNNNYTIEVKGQQPYTAKSNTALICGSNKKPFDINDRRYNLVEYNNVQLFDRDVVEQYKDILHIEYSPEEWDAIFFDAFTSCPFNFKFKSVCDVKYISEKYIDFVEDIRSLKEINKELFFEPVTIKEIAASLQEMNDGKHIKALQKEYRRSVLKNIVSLVKDNVLQPDVKINGALEYSKYDLNKIADLQICSDLIEVTADLNNPIFETEQSWNALINQYTPTNNDPNGGIPQTTKEEKTFKRTPIEDVKTETKLALNDNMTDDEMLNEVLSVREKLSELEPYTAKNIVCADLDAMNVTEKDLKKFDVLVCDDKYSKPTNVVKDDTQFLLTARFKPEYKKHLMEENSLEDLNRRSENLIPVFFVYEMDNIDKETQFSIANNLYKNNVWTVTDSGNKSLHTLVLIDPNQAEEIAKDFKHYWKFVAEKLYGKVAKYLDPACASIGRLTRFPDGKRDNGKIQYCIFKNDNVQPIDLTQEIEKHNDELKSKEFVDVMREVISAEKSSSYKENDPDNVDHLRNAVAKSNNPAGQIAVDLVDGVDPGSGANYIGAIGYCEKAIGPKTAAFVRSIAHKLHPTNIRA